MIWGLIPAFSQDDSSMKNSLFIEVQTSYGFIMPHVKAIEYLVQGHIPALDVRFGKNTTGNHLWEQLYNFPRIGAGYYRCSYNNPEVLGHVNAFYGFINIPLIKKNNRFSVNTEIDFGFSYLTKIFDIYDNYNNIAIGSHGNVFFKSGVDTKIRILPRAYLINGISFSHCSNGRVQEPNLGINVVAISGGINYQLGKDNYTYNRINPPEFIRFNEYSIVTAAGIKQWRRHDENRYFASTLSFNCSRNINYLQRIGLGMDIFFDASIETSIEYYDEVESAHKDLYRSGIHISHDLVYSRLALVFNTGYYFYTKYVEITSLYSRLGLRYKVTDHLLANLTLKTHFAQADFIEWGIGYTWKTKKNE